jgi:hypothetical protein
MSIRALAKRIRYGEGKLRKKLAGERGTTAIELVEIAMALGLYVELRPNRPAKGNDNDEVKEFNRE